MTGSERQLVTDLRRTLLHLHKTLLDWERAGYERQHGRHAPGEWLRIVMADPQLAWRQRQQWVGWSSQQEEA